MLNKKKTEENEILLKTKRDRRLLSNVPDPSNTRTNRDRRGGGTVTDRKGNAVTFSQSDAGVRYVTALDVKVSGYKDGGTQICNFTLKSVDISGTGILLSCDDKEQVQFLEQTDYVILKFTIAPGSMPEGFDTKVKLKAKFVRKQEKDEKIECGFQFEKSLAEHVQKTRGRYLYLVSTFMLMFVTFLILFMRAESLLYFTFNRVLYFYSIITAVFLLSRYLFGMLYRSVPIDPDFTPGVTILVPCFNEEDWIDRTIISCMNQDYPADKLEVIVIDDYSTDDSVGKIRETIEDIYKDNSLHNTKSRLSYAVLEQNGGKREALSIGAQKAKHDLIVFVDSDSFLETTAIRNLVQPFRDPKMGGVSGRTDVANVYTNWITKMQTIRYFIAFRIMKAAESYFDTVTCLSGPLACYRKDILMKNLDKWRNQEFLGQPATFGDDRAMTNMILRTHRTTYQDTAICTTIVPNKRKMFLKQQIRWKRSWMRESFIAGSFIWKKEPFAALFFYMSFLIPFIAPIVVIYNFIYVPAIQRIFPATFIIGFLMMSFLMSFAYLLFRRSKLWLYGVFFCVYYLGVLLWQMPYAWFTFWKTTWGTRMTPADIEEIQRKEDKTKPFVSKGENTYQQ